MFGPGVSAKPKATNAKATSVTGDTMDISRQKNRCDGQG
jgi:hypothetical protein